MSEPGYILDGDDFDESVSSARKDDTYALALDALQAAAYADGRRDQRADDTFAIEGGMSLASAVIEHLNGTDSPLERQARAYIETLAKDKP